MRVAEAQIYGKISPHALAYNKLSGSYLSQFAACIDGLPSSVTNALHKRQIEYVEGSAYALNNKQRFLIESFITLSLFLRKREINRVGVAL